MIATVFSMTSDLEALKQENEELAKLLVHSQNLLNLMKHLVSPQSHTPSGRDLSLGAEVSGRYCRLEVAGRHHRLVERVAIAQDTALDT